MGIRPSVPSVRMLTGGSGGSGRKSGVGAKSASNSTTASPTPVQNEATKYILHEEWLADVCGVSRRRLTIRSDSESLPAKSFLISACIDGEEPLTPTEIELWSKSFDKLIQSRRGRLVFLEFLRSEYSEENLCFWLACEDLKGERDPERIEEKVRFIYDDFISILSPREVSLDGKARDLINKRMSHPDGNTFEEAQQQIYTLMQRDSYPRFLNSSAFRSLVEQ